jgi:hypothetical protein
MQMYDELDSQQPNRKALLTQLGGGLPTAGRVPGIAPGEPAPGARMPEAPPIEPQAQKPSLFQSGNSSLSGYLQEAAAAFRPELIKHQGDAARKSAAEQYFRSLEPEMRARGWQGGEFKGEKYQDGGRWKDLYQDIEGVANAQHIDVTDDGGGGAPNMGMGLPSVGGMHPLLGGDALAGIQAAIGQHSGPSSNLQALLQQLQGGR